MRLQAQRLKGSLTATRLYLVRHGQVADGHTDRYHGHNDIGLSAQGVRQFEDLAAQLTAVPLAGVYSSDLTRAMTGAEIISRGRNLTPQIIPEFREIHFGAWEGLTFTEIMPQLPRRTGGALPGPHQLPHPRGRKPPGREFPGPAPASRPPHPTPNEAFLLVAHAGVNRVILSEALGLPLDHLFRLDQNYGCLNIIDYFPDLAVVRLLNGGVNGVAAA